MASRFYIKGKKLSATKPQFLTADHSLTKSEAEAATFTHKQAQKLERELNLASATHGYWLSLAPAK